MNETLLFEEKNDLNMTIEKGAPYQEDNFYNGEMNQLESMDKKMFFPYKRKFLKKQESLLPQ